MRAQGATARGLLMFLLFLPNTNFRREGKLFTMLRAELKIFSDRKVLSRTKFFLEKKIYYFFLETKDCLNSLQ
jgi:hypothetical protein